MPTLSYLRRKAKASSRALVEVWWGRNRPASYKELELEWTHGAPEEMDMPRRMHGFLLQLRSGHGDFAEYHDRLCHINAERNCACGQRKTPLHFVSCTMMTQHRRMGRWPRFPPGVAPGNDASIFTWIVTDYKAFETVMKKTRFLDYCPRNAPATPARRLST